jgi:hypothetical protein
LLSHCSLGSFFFVFCSLFFLSLSFDFWTSSRSQWTKETFYFTYLKLTSQCQCIFSSYSTKDYITSLSINKKRNTYSLNDKS